jgi:hypothetical protein
MSFLASGPMFVNGEINASRSAALDYCPVR